MEVRKATMSAFHQAGIQQVDEGPSPRRRGRAARRVASSIGLGLERNFETKVSMTPPARLPGNANDSPFNVHSNNHHHHHHHHHRHPHHPHHIASIDFPASEAMRVALPRSRAFGPFSPLHATSLAFDSAAPTEQDDLVPVLHSHTGLRRTIVLQGHLCASDTGSAQAARADSGPSRTNGLSAATAAVAAASPNPHLQLYASPASLAENFALPRQARSQNSELRPSTEQNVHPTARRRRTATTPVRQMCLDNDGLGHSSSPASPTPATALEWSLIDPKSAEHSDVDNDDQSDLDGSDYDVNTLRPGANSFSSRRMSGIRSISTSHSRQQSHPISAFTAGGGEAMARSATTSSIRETISPNSSSASISGLARAEASDSRSSGINDSPFKTPNKRRARAQGSSSSSLRGRNFSTASPVAAPLDSEEGSLFGSTSSSSLARDMLDQGEMHMLGNSKDSKRRSVGSLNLWQQEASMSALPAIKEQSQSFLANARRTSLATLPVRYAGTEPDQSIGEMSPGRFAFDDSGVALLSPAAAPASEKKGDRFAASVKHLALTSMKPVDGSPASPLNLAAARRATSDQSNNAGHAFGKMAVARERSSLAREACFSDDASSTNSTPEMRRTFGTAVSVPEGLVSPPRSKARSNARASQSSSSLAIDGGTAPYLTPQNYRNVVPLQAAFMSTGLASKRSRPTLGTLDPLTGDPLPPLPAMLSYNNSTGAGSPGTYQSSGTMAASLGLRDVVAAANAHAAATANSAGPSTMPDTPMKKPISTFGSGLHAHDVAQKGVPMRSKLGMSLSPGSADGNESSSGGSAYGGDSPLLSQGCESPTLGLTSFASDTRHRAPMSMLEAVSCSGTIDNAEAAVDAGSGSPLMASSLSPVKTMDKKRGIARQSLPAQTRSNDETLRAQAITRPLSLSRPPLGLQRKSSFGPTSDQATALSAQSPFLDAVVPSTPTRHSASIKWYEAAQLVSTPSPSHRRRPSEARRESWQAYGSMRGKTTRQGSGSMSGNALPASMLATPTDRHVRGFRPSYYEKRFAVQGALGVGEFSQVDRAEDKQTGFVYAVKRMKRAYAGPRDRLRRLEEVDILRHLSTDGGHPNIVGFVDAWEEAGHLFVQTELCPCVDFSSFLQHFSNMGGSLDEARLWKVMRELSEGLAYIHGMQILHLDIKPANIFITDIATLKIGDFGLATRWPPVDAATILAGTGMCDEADNTNGGTGVASNVGALELNRGGKSLEREGDREYLAPEVLLHGTYSAAADVFSLGLVVLEAAGNVVLPDNGEPWQKLRNDDLSDVDLSQFSQSLVRLIRRCLSAAPEGRPTVNALRQHPVMQAVGMRCALGVQVSELDQLPLFDMPSGESSQSLGNVGRQRALSIAAQDAIISSSSGGGGDEGGAGGGDDDDGDRIDTEMMIDDEVKPVPHTPRPAPVMTIGSSGGPASAADMERTSSTKSNKSALGLEGLDEDETVLNFRGALIYENLDFLLSILDADPDPEARLTFGAGAQIAVDVQLGPASEAHRNVPTISVDMDDGSGFDERLGRASHAPIRRSPLSHQTTSDLADMDIDV